MAIDAAEVALVFLAAGQSRRFGTGDKLLHPFRGQPLVVHAARTLAGVPFGAHVAVAGRAVAALLPAPFRSIANPDPRRGLSSSIAIGVETLLVRGHKACMVALGDMPLVPADHFTALLRNFDATDPQAMLATRGPGELAMVPALFGQGRFAELRGLTGDRGARSLLAGAPTIACDAALLVDCDEPEDFAD